MQSITTAPIATGKGATALFLLPLYRPWAKCQGWSHKMDGHIVCVAAKLNIEDEGLLYQIFVKERTIGLQDFGGLDMLLHGRRFAFSHDKNSSRY